MMVGDWLNAISTVPIDKLREVLYNIEAFRADAINIALVEPKPTGGKGTLASKALSSSTKTSGTSNLVSTGGSNGTGGGSSLTGKNPFAILKASAIASTQ